MPRLFADFVQDEGEARIGQILGGRELYREARFENGFETDPRLGDRRDLLSREDDPFLVGEREIETGDAEQLIGEELTGPDFARHFLVRFDHPAGSRVREAADPLFDSRDSHHRPLC